MNSLRQQFSCHLGLDLQSLSFIKENAYCSIYRAVTDGQPIIIKHYKGEDPHLAEAEAKALDFYHQVAKDDPNLIDSRAIHFNPERNLLCIQYVDGECFSDFLYRRRNSPDLQPRAIRIMGILGDLLRRFYELTQTPGAETAPFIFEYFEYCSRRLERLPMFGPLLFSGYVAQAERLAEDFRAAKVAPSFVHGDFVFKNIHVHGDRVGLIDFANTNPRSHVLNDVYNLYFALESMLLPEELKTVLWSSFCQGLRVPSFPEIAHQFYREYHRRRWLMLKLTSLQPRDWLQAVAGLLRFRPTNLS